MTKRPADEDDFRARKRRCLEHWKKHGVLQPVHPSDDGFADVVATHYPALQYHRNGVPSDLQRRISSCCEEMTREGYFRKRIVMVRDGYKETSVKRCMVGVPGLTFPYFDLKVFCYPWSNASPPSPEMHAATQAMLDHPMRTVDGVDVQVDARPSLNLESLKELASHLDETAATRAAERSSNCFFMNYFTPTSRSAWRDDPYYGLGPLAIKWHRDQNIMPGSHSIVYTLFPSSVDKEKSPVKEATEVAEASDSNDPTGGWRLCFQRRWHLETPPLVCPTNNGDVFMMCDGMNDVEQQYDHALVAGTTPRFSLNSREVLAPMNMLEDILGMCTEALALDDVSPATLDRVFRAFGCVEFDWLRQFWLQGAVHTALHSGWWTPNIMVLERLWIELGEKLDAILGELKDPVTDAPLIEVATQHLTWRLGQTNLWMDVYDSPLYNQLPSNRRPLAPPGRGLDSDKYLGEFAALSPTPSEG